MVKQPQHTGISRPWPMLSRRRKSRSWDQAGLKELQILGKVEIIAQHNETQHIAGHIATHYGNIDQPIAGAPTLP